MSIVFVLFSAQTVFLILHTGKSFHVMFYEYVQDCAGGIWI